MHTFDDLTEKIKEGIKGINLDRQPRELYDPIYYTLDLGGKRLRPALCLLACDIFGGNIDEALMPAIGIEMFHNFTLLHDDIMDQAPIRRGKPTVHVKWNPNTAILSGDTMMALSYEHIMKAPEWIRTEVFNVFNRTAIEVCEGQQLDMNFEKRSRVSINEYIEMIRLKTAVLLAASLKIGAKIGGAGDDDAQKLYLFGENIGIAFQLMDDLLDVFSDTDKFGKISGGDILTNKKTFLYLKAFELSDTETLEKLKFLFGAFKGSDEEKIKGVKEIYNQLQIKNHTGEQIEKYYRRGLMFLDEVEIDMQKKTELMKFAEMLKNREK
ncbi:MAG: polyprenyl synthetase family protein [Bacteroidales bacterium]|nr:polyprenyl synthetase family protein [Bacteroidales bacterium]